MGGPQVVNRTLVGERSVAIQDRSLLFRNSLALLVEAAPGIRSAISGADDEFLLHACRANALDAVLFESDRVPWSTSALIANMRRELPNLIMVGSLPDEGQRDHLRNVIHVRRGASREVFARALKGLSLPAAPGVRSVAAQAFRDPDALSRREFQVLTLISGGLTTQQIGDRLGLSVKTVESHRERLFTKLGVQNQSHAVSLAIRKGLLGGNLRKPEAPRS
jgi:DNA-binding CsgD family transcriptional regulator